MEPHRRPGSSAGCGVTLTAAGGRHGDDGVLFETPTDEDGNLYFDTGVFFEDLADSSQHMPEYKYTVTGQRRKWWDPEGPGRVQVGRQCVLNGERIALFRFGAHVVAIQDTCSHAGGSLHLGDIEEVDGHICVSCPRHGFCFDIATGKGVQPTSFEQEVFPTRLVTASSCRSLDSSGGGGGSRTPAGDPFDGHDPGDGDAGMLLTSMAGDGDNGGGGGGGSAHASRPSAATRTAGSAALPPGASRDDGNVSAGADDANAGVVVDDEHLLSRGATPVAPVPYEGAPQQTSGGARGNGDGDGDDGDVMEVDNEGLLSRGATPITIAYDDVPAVAGDGDEVLLQQFSAARVRGLVLHDDDNDLEEEEAAEDSDDYADGVHARPRGYGSNGGGGGGGGADHVIRPTVVQSRHRASGGGGGPAANATTAAAAATAAAASPELRRRVFVGFSGLAAGAFDEDF